MSERTSKKNEMASLSSHTQILNTDLTAKHSFFKNPDLLTQAFSYLEMENDRGYRLFLFNAALTSKDFLGVALNALWKELDSLVPLLRLLPAYHIEDGAYILSGKVSPVDWDRMEQYSRRVRVFQGMLPDIQHPRVAISTYIRIAQLQPSFLLPSLRHLRCSLEARSMSHIFLFLSPSLESLELTDIPRSENILVRSFLDTLESPVLNRIVLRNGWLPADTLLSISQFKQLRSLELSDAVFMNNLFFREVLGTLPSLVNLTLKAIDSETDHEYIAEKYKKSSSKSEGPKCFNALQNLCLTGPPFLIRDLLEIIDSPCLKSIEIHPAIDWRIARPAKSSTEPGDLTRSMAIIGSKWSSIENLVIGQHNADNSEPPRVGFRFTLSTSIINLLMGLHEMRTFHLKDWRIAEMDVTLGTLVISWPKLTTLILPVDQMPVSLLTLGAIAEKCPGLRYLQTRVNIFVIPTFNLASATHFHRLKVLSVGSSPNVADITLQSQISVAQNLDSIFPCLESIQTHIGFNSKFWSEIHQLVKLCQNVRQSEAKRHQQSFVPSQT